MGRRSVALGAVLAAGFLGEFGFALLLLPLLQHYLPARDLGVELPGYILAVYGLSRLIAQIPLGAFADAVDRRFAVSAGYLVVLLAGLAFWPPVPVAALLIAAAFFGLGHALADPIVPAALAEGTLTNERGRILALLNLVQVAGLTVGVAGGAFVADLMPAEVGFSLVAAANALTLLLLAVVAAPLLQRAPQPAAGRPAMHAIRRSLVRSLARPIANERTGLILLVLFALALSVNLLSPDLNLFVVQRLHSSMHVMTLYLIPAGLAGVAALPLGGWLADRAGRLPPLLGGAGVGALALAVLTHMQHPWQVALIAIPAAGGIALTMPASNAALLDIADPDHRALVLSSMMAAQGLAEAVGPLLSGILILLGSAAAPIGAAAVALWLAIPATILYGSAPRNDRAGEEVPYTPFTRFLSRASLRAHAWYLQRQTVAPPEGAERKNTPR